MKKDNSKKYAKALFQLADETKQIEIIKDSFREIKFLYSEDVVRFLVNPFVDKEEKINLVKDNFPDLPEIILNLMYMLIDRNKMYLLSEIEEKYNDAFLLSRNIIKAKIISTDKLEKTSIEKIKKAINRITNKDILVDEEIDKSLIGGLLIKVGDFVIDGSIRGRVGILSREIARK
ncbi:MAG: ATP synthase F1 subunit delta [Elusimicrobia bacterium]|nr:ATP synthase F1 subunit delta [Elusimicrobiota bacterium]